MKISSNNKKDDEFEDCLYFSANSLSRYIGKLADESFMQTGLSPSHAFLLMLVCRKKSITINEAASVLHLDPSTVTRFVDKLVVKQCLAKQKFGKYTKITATKVGVELLPQIEKSWDIFHTKYEKVLSKEFAVTLTANITKANSVFYDN